LSDGLGLVLEKTLREPARGNPAMRDAGDRAMAGAEALQKIGEHCNCGVRGELAATSKGWPNRSVQAREDTELQASEDRLNARMPSARTLRPNVRAKRETTV
jgi:hypothetical protein